MIAGVRDLPDSATTNLLVDVLRNELSHFTFEEITQMLRMNSIGDFDETVEAFNSLTANFLLKVVKHYRKFRKDAGNKLIEVKDRIRQRKKPELTALQKEIVSVFGVIYTYEKFKSDQETYGESTVYDILKRYKMINFTEAQEEDEIKIAIEAQNLLIATTKDLSVRETLTRIISDENRAHLNARITAQGNLCKIYFRNILESNYDFAKELEEKFLCHHQITLEELNENIKNIPHNFFPV